jgi:hypothetical protein
MQEDFNAGLIGFTIVYSRGQINKTMVSNREFTLLCMQYDESDSFMSAINGQKFRTSNPSQASITYQTIGQGYGNY